MAFSPKRADAGRLKDIMSRGIRELKKTGRMREILERYGLTDWK
jgi:polar amino acid transport system substrate-binding protein